MAELLRSGDDPATDITLEVFNYCQGTCTGCMLTTTERRDAMPVMALSRFKQALGALKDWGAERGIEYRPVLLFGDLPWLPLNIQENYYQAVADQG